MRASESDRPAWKPTRRALTVAIVLAAVYLAVSAGPVAAASTNLAVASINTTCADFSSATLTNMSATGSGAACSVELDPESGFSDGFEPDAADAGVPDDWENRSAPGFQNVTTARAHSGSQSYFVDGSPTLGRARPAYQPLGGASTENVTFWIYQTSTGTNLAGLELYEGGSAWTRLGIRNGDLQYSDGAAWQTISTTPDANEWVRITIFNIDASKNEFDVAWEVQGGASGSTADIGAFASISNGYDETVLLTTSDGAFYDDFSVGGGGGTPGTYVANHTAEKTEQGFVNVTENDNATVTITYRGDSNGDGTFDQLLNQTTGITTAANHTFTWSTFSGSSVQLELTVENATGNGAPSFTMADEGVQFTNHDPLVDNSSASPTGEISSATPTLTIPINDSDFPLAQGDSVTATAEVDGATVGIDTLAGNGTASVTLSSPLTGGDHTVNWTVEDNWGGSNQSQTFTISTPGNITIRNETEPHAIIKSADVEIVISGDQETIDKRTVTDGNISLTGLPLDEEYIVIVDAPDHHQRSIFVPDVFEQSDVFLLNDSIASREQEFRIEDRTGLFGEPVLEIQRGINKSVYDPDAQPKYQWLTIAGDRLGASETYTTDLEYKARYRLVVRQDENTRVLGEHTVEANETVPLPIGQIEWSMPENQQYNWSFSRMDHPTAGSGEALRFQINDTTDSTSDIRGVIHEAGNESNQLTTFSSSATAGTYVLTQPLSNDQANVTWQVEWNATRGDEDIGSTGVGGFQRLGSTVPLFSAIQQLDPDWRSGIALVVIIGVGFIYSGLFASVGSLLIVGTNVVLWSIGLSPVALGITTLALVIAIAYRLAERGDG